MFKPRQILAKRADGKLAVLHLSEDAVAAKEVWSRVKSKTEGAGEFLLLGPWGPERHFTVDTNELKPAKAAKAVK